MSEIEKDSFVNTIEAFTEEEWEVIMRKIPWEYMTYEVKRRLHKLGAALEALEGM